MITLCKFLAYGGIFREMGKLWFILSAQKESKNVVWQNRYNNQISDFLLVIILLEMTTFDHLTFFWP